MDAPPASSFIDPLHVAASRTPAAPLLVTPGRTLTYAEAERLVAATAARLDAVGAPDRLGLYLPNGWPLVALLLAAFRSGRVACPVSTRVPPAAVPPLLATAGATLLLTDADGVRAPASALAVLHPGDVLREDGQAGETPRGSIDQPATVVFTSGSTGTPRAALHSLGNHRFSALGSNQNIALAPGDRWLLALPLYHVGGLGILFRCLWAGATAVIPASEEDAAEAVARTGITHVSLVATQLRRWLRAAAPPAGLRAILLGGSAMPPSLLDEATARAWPVHTSYGLTEMASQVTTTPPGASRRQLATSGRVLRYRELQLSAGGEILVRGATRFLGYVSGEALETPFDDDGWFATGDLGTWADDGALVVVGRTDNLFISGGENIQPEEIEQALCSLDGVEQAVVVPVPDDEFGWRPVAFVRRADGAPTLAGLPERLAPLLPRFKIPRTVLAWPAEEPARGFKIDRAFFQRRAEAAVSEKR